MTWHYAIGKNTEGEEDLYCIIEVYDDHDSEGMIRRGWTNDAIAPQGDTTKELLEDLNNMINDASKYPVVDMETGKDIDNGTTNDARN